MTTQTMIAVAKSAFTSMPLTQKRILIKSYSANYLTTRKNIKNLLRYSFEEFDFTTIYDDFFIWYYLKFLENTDYDVKFYNPPVTKVTALIIKPVRRVVENQQLAIRTCEPIRADFWSIYIQDAAGLQHTLADCSTENSAIKLIKSLRNLIAHYEIKLLLIQNDDKTTNILSSHLIESMTVDWTNATLSPVKIIEPLAQCGQFFQCISTYSEHDQYIQHLIKNSRF